MVINMVHDMTKGSPGVIIFQFAVPMAIGNLLQQLYNIADTVIIGRYVSSKALAAVGNATNITFLLLAIAAGFGIGTSIIISQYFGAGHIGKVMTTICTGVILALVLSIVLTAVGILECKNFLKIIKTP